MRGPPLPSAPAPPAREEIAQAGARQPSLRRGLRTPPRLGGLLAGGARGNEQLTAVTGAALLVLLAMLGVTILRIGPLLGPHMFIGLLLIGPVLLKMASTGYRFARYYTHDPAYVEEGPPPAGLRILAPFVVVSTVVVFATGVALLVAGPSSRGAPLSIHKISFIAWIAFTGLHVLGHLRELPRALSLRNRATAVLAGGDPPSERLVGYSVGNAGQMLSLAGAIVAGTVLAVVYIPQFAPWLHGHHFGH